jgi:hypothetical protein
MWSRLRPYKLHPEPKGALLYARTPVQFVRALVPRRMEERQQYQTSLLSEPVLNRAFSRPYNGVTGWVELRPRLAISSVTLPMQFGMFS